MNNTSFKYTLFSFFVSTSLLLVLYFGFQYALDFNKVRFNAISILLFFYVTTLVVLCVNECLLLLVPSHMGYAFLFSILIKFGLFLFLFGDQVLILIDKSLVEKILLVIPLVLFLTLEVMLLTKRIKMLE